jgi:asparagine synthase (glutamine-hydrolysing)
MLWNWRAGTIYERLLPDPLRRWVSNRVVPSLGGRAGRYARRSFLAMPRTPASMLFDNFAAVRLADQQHLLAGRLAQQSTPGGVYGPALAYFETPASSVSLLGRLLYADLKTYLVELLMKQDQMSMAASIESRVPFLDHELVEFVATVPDAWKLRGWQTKRVLRHAMKGRVPDCVLRRAKMGFPVPFASWVRGPWAGVAREVLLDRRARERGVFDTGAVDALLRRHANGQEVGDQVWSLLNLELWFRTFIDGEGSQHLPPPTLRATSSIAFAHASAIDAPLRNGSPL